MSQFLLVLKLKNWDDSNKIGWVSRYVIGVIFYEGVQKN